MSDQSTHNLRDEEPPRTRIADFNRFHLALIIIAGIFATTLAQPQVLGKIPLQNILKNDLHLEPEKMADFFFWCGLAWYFKPIAGILTDGFPVFGTRRRWYLILGALFALLSWVALGHVSKTYESLLWTSIIVNFFMVISSTVVGAYLVEAGQRLGATGRLSALRQLVSSVCQFVNGPISGRLAEGSLLTAAYVNAGIVASVIPVAWLFMRERKLPRDPEVFHNARVQLKKIAKSRNLWIAIGVIGLFYFAPGFNTLLYYHQQNDLKFSNEYIGDLGMFNGGAGILAAVLYAFLIRFTKLRTMITIGITCAAVGTLCFLRYDGPGIAKLIEAQNGFFFTLAEVSLLDLAAKATPAGCEGLGYSLILSARNLGIFGADKLGTKLQASYHWSFDTMVYLNAGSTAIVLIFLPFLPLALMSSKDTGQAQDA